MTSSSKLIVASVVLAVGYAVASFVGSPVAPYLPQPADAITSGAVALPSANLSPLPSAGNTNTSGDARFLSEVPSVERDVTVDRVAPQRDPGDASLVSRQASDGLDRDLSPATARTEHPSSVPMELSTPPLLDSTRSDLDAVPLPRATLKDARVRSLSIDSEAESSAAVVVGSPPLLPRGDVNAASFTTGATSDRASAEAPAAEATSHRGTARRAPPREDDEFGPWRTHLVKDGDSLEKLARRYLGDETRSSEIFAFNRELLADPELLPIGSELIIPPRPSRPSSAAASTGQDPDQAADAATVSTQRVMPVRPIPAESTVTPRAKLLRPLPAGQ